MFYSLHGTRLDSFDRARCLGFALQRPSVTWTTVPAQEPRGIYNRIDFVYYRGSLETQWSGHLDENNSGVTPWPSAHRAALSIFRWPRCGQAPSQAMFRQRSHEVSPIHARKIVLPLSTQPRPGSGSPEREIRGRNRVRGHSIDDTPLKSND